MGSVNYPDGMDSSTVLPGEDCPEMPDLKPCPFCGSIEASLFSIEGLSWVECNCCSAQGPCMGHETWAANGWNRRA